uniref:Inner centromere protein ARK-binding domain-containing protein n=1 Tax=Oryzias latipes TaxID=8090 RepID=A0A3P9H1Q4_ORYLA
MNSVLLSVRSLMQMFEGKAKEFMNEIDNVHMVWLEEIQQEANRIFSRDFNAAPELMPKTPSQKKNSRRKRVSLGRQEESQTRRRFSRGRRSNLRGSPVKSLNLIAEEPIAEGSSSQASNTAQPKRTTRKNKQTKPDVTGEENTSVDDNDAEASHDEKPVLPNKEDVDKKDETNAEDVTYEQACDAALSPPKIPLPEVVVRISSEERLSAEFVQQLEDSPGRKAVKVPIAKPPRKTRRSSARCSLKVRHSLAGLRHSMTQASVHRASQRSMLKKKASRTNNSTCSSNIDEDSPMDTTDENDHVHSETEQVPAEAPSAEAVPEISEDNSQEPVNAPLERITRSMAANSEKLAPSSMPTSKPKVSSPVKTDVGEKQQGAKIVRQSSRSTKRKAPDTIEDSPTKRLSPPKKTQSAVKPSMRSFLHTVQKNQMLMMTPNSLGRSGVIKSFIKHTTPLKIDSKTKERYKLEALKKKQEQEEERMRKMEEEKRKKQEELKRKRDERIRRVLEAKGKEEQREEEKKKKIEQKMAQIDEKNDKRQADEKAKKKVAMKRQEELELKKKLEEEAKKKKLQQLEEEKRQQELMAKKKAEEEEQVRRALELKREQERERELERERHAAAERERKEKEKALALQRELERAVREKEMRELEERRKALEEKRKLEEQQRMAEKEKALKEREEARLKEVAAEKKLIQQMKSVLNTPDKKGCGLNGTYNVESSPQSYAITPKGASKPLVTSKNLDDYGMDQNSDDSTDDESAPRKPIPSWAEGPYLKQIIMKQYFNPPDLDSFFGTVEPPKLENIFYKSKPRYFKRTSSAVWHSPPAGAK